MNQNAIDATLTEAQAAATAGSSWAATYRDHVSYLRQLLQSYGPPLHEKLREQSRIIAELQRTCRRQRVALTALTVFVAVLAAVSWLPGDASAPPSSLVSVAAAEQMPPVDRVLGVIDGPIDVDGATFGWYCTEWQPTGQPCASPPNTCLWTRWCTACIPECDWYKDTECRYSASGCPFLLAPPIAPPDERGE